MLQGTGLQHVSAALGGIETDYPVGLLDRLLEVLEDEITGLQRDMERLGQEGRDVPADLADRWDRAQSSFSFAGGFEREARIERVLAGLGIAGQATLANREIVREFVRQSVVDLQRTVDALGHFPELDAQRLAFAGFSLGAIVGATFCAVDPRPRGAALALAGGGFGGPDVDPAVRIGNIAPRPLLFVNMSEDRVVPPEAAKTLIAAAGKPKSSHWFDGGHLDLPGAALKLMWQFLREQLTLPAP